VAASCGVRPILVLPAAALALGGCKDPLLGNGDQIVRATFAGTRPMLELVVAHEPSAASSRTFDRELVYSLETVDPTTGAHVSRASIGYGSSDDPPAIAAGLGGVVLERDHHLELHAASSGGLERPLASVPADVRAKLDASARVADLVQEAPVGSDSELTLRGYDQRFKLVRAKGGIAEGSAAPLVFWKGGFLADDHGPLETPDRPGFYIAAYDGLGTGKHFTLARVDHDGGIVWSQVDSARAGNSDLMCARLVDDTLVIVFSRPANEVVAYDLRDGHVHWRVTP
jgi:hypothetical protein